jgi:hypothetical protein
MNILRLVLFMPLLAWSGEPIETPKEPPTIVIETPKKEFKPQEAARVQLFEGIPGVVVKGPHGFATIFRFTEYSGGAGEAPNIDIGEVPRWLSKQLTKDEKALLNEEQLKILDELEAEAAIIRPLAKKLGELRGRVVTTFKSNQDVHESTNKSRQKAYEKGDKAAMSEEAENVRRSRCKNAFDAMQDANKDLATWVSSPDYLALEFSREKIRKMFATALAKYPIVKEKK